MPAGVELVLLTFGEHIMSMEITTKGVGKHIP